MVGYERFLVLEVRRGQLLGDGHLHICIYLHTCIHLHICIPVPKLPKTAIPQTAEIKSVQTTSRGMTDIQLCVL